MTTTRQPPRQISLRALARELGVHHASLSAAIHDRRLVRGVQIDEHGHAVVLDADLAAENWHGVHTPRLAMSRLAVARRQAADAIYDPVLDHEFTPAELLAERAALAVLVTALVADVPDHEALTARVAARLREVAWLHGASADVVARAEAELESAIGLLADAAEDEP